MEVVMRVPVVLVLLLFFAGTIVSVPVSAQENSQTLGIIYNPPSEPPPTAWDYLISVGMADNAGINGAVVAYRWSQIEPTAGELDVTQAADDLNMTSRWLGYTTLLGIQLLNTTDKETPADLLDVSFDDPRMLERFEALFEALLPHLNENVRYLSIGNEVDGYLAAHPEEWEAYRAFYEAAAAYVHQAAPSLQVGITFTFGGALTYPDEFAWLNEASDVIILTYYPSSEGFTFDNPAAPLDDFPRMVEIAGGRPVVLQEVGFASSELLGSSEADQAAFVSSVFSAWEQAGNAVPFLDFFLLHDLPDQMCSELEAYYGLQHERFHAFLCTLGLRRADGTPKQAWDTFAEQASQWEAGG
jgi:hypothetical protein